MMNVLMTARLRDFFFSSLVLLISTATFAAPPKSASEVTRLEVLSETQGVAPGESTHLGLRFFLKPGWHTYWLNPGDSGAGVRLDLKSEPAIRQGPLLYPVPERLDTKNLVSFGYEKEVLIPFRIDVPRDIKVGESLALEIKVEWLVCQDICIPARETKTLSLPVVALNEVKPSAAFDLFRKTHRLIPRRVSDQGEEASTGLARLVLPEGFNDFQPQDFFPLPDSGMALAKPVFKKQGNTIEFAFQKADFFEGQPKVQGVLSLKTAKGETRGLSWAPVESTSTSQKTRNQAPLAETLRFLLFAFLGGMILNLMPCVFPVLSLKLFSWTKQTAHSQTRVRLENISYTLGVVLSFLILGGTLALLRAGGEKLGWGFQLQSPLFVSALCFLFFLMALNFLGVYEIDFLNPNWGSNLTRKRDLSGSFFTGVFAVLVASPCTAPFMGAALGFALSQSTFALLSIFGALGLGLAFPSLLFSLWPSLLRFLPRPGAWMEHLRNFMAFPLFLTVLWMLWLLGGLSGLSGVILVLTGFTGIGFAFWFRNRTLSWTLIALVIALCFIGVRSLSAEPPPAKTVAIQDDWIPFQKSMLQAPRTEALFIDFTADWCLTCKVNEKLIFSSETLKRFFKDQGIRMVKADWTKQDPDISDVLTEYDRAGVPLYLFFPPGSGRALVLPDVLTEELIKTQILQTLNKEKTP